MRHRRHSFATAVVERRIYAAGGIWDDEKLSSVEYYCPGTNSWTVLDLGMPAARAYFQLAVIQDKMYAVGLDDDEKLTIQSIDSKYTDDQWSTETVNLPTYFRNHASVALNGDIYVVGWIFGDPDDGEFYRWRPGDATTSFVKNVPAESRFDGARLAVVKTRPCDAERERGGTWNLYNFV